MTVLGEEAIPIRVGRRGMRNEVFYLNLRPILIIDIMIKMIYDRIFSQSCERNSKCFLARYRSLVNSSRILQLIVTHPSSLRVRTTPVRDFLNSSCPTSPFNQVAVLTPLAGGDSRLGAEHPPTSVNRLFGKTSGEAHHWAGPSKALAQCH